MDRLNKFLNQKEKLFCIDVDDVLLNTTSYWMHLLNNDTEFIDKLKKANKYPISVDDITTWDYMGTLLGDNVFKYHHDGSIYNEYTLVPYAYEFIKKLIDKIGLERILFVTASEGSNESIKDKILMKEFGIPTDNIIHSSNKYEYYKNNIFLDDGFHNFDNLLDCIETIPILLNRPWNEQCDGLNVNRIASLKDISDLL